jgi:hypothetical protein
LSFPAVYRSGEDVWIYPESAASGKLTMYKYNTSDDTLEPYSTIIDKEVSDAVLYQGFGKPCMIATSRPNSNGKYVEIYESDDVFSNYNLCDKIEFNDKIGRSAGDIMSYNGDLIRPAQICNNSYGEGLCFQKFNKIDGKYTLQEISRVNPPRGYNGLHTINCYKGYKVVDLRRVMYPFFFKLNAIIRKIF